MTSLRNFINYTKCIIIVHHNNILFSLILLFYIFLSILPFFFNISESDSAKLKELEHIRSLFYDKSNQHPELNPDSYECFKNSKAISCNLFVTYSGLDNLTERGIRIFAKESDINMFGVSLERLINHPQGAWVLAVDTWYPNHDNSGFLVHNLGLYNKEKPEIAALFCIEFNSDPELIGKTIHRSTYKSPRYK